jgi:hypothetical protein
LGIELPAACGTTTTRIAGKLPRAGLISYRRGRNASTGVHGSRRDTASHLYLFEFTSLLQDRTEQTSQRLAGVAER